ncbi:circularly permutated Ras protein 1-like isoform X2 [Cyprinodon tularosa]|uniref:circularly permutated Ras protein 1-like isoform X2 n=1 Tax=Cyprinodon tularosa TaxID=77115 RepID=UPI0018E26859|nr:circularly permutated Ras protein 1-like isoform X2 [Cyprinodon tularosa]
MLLLLLYRYKPKASTSVNWGPMEFACGYVYVPQSLSQREIQRSNGAKRSALLPPGKPIRPRTAPPPPPTQTVDPRLKADQSAASSPAQLEKSREVRIPKPFSLFYKFPEVSRKAEAASSPVGAGSPLMPPSQKTALLPLTVRSTATTDSNKNPAQPHASSDANSQTPDYDQPNYEADSNMHPADNLYSFTLPEGPSGKVKVRPECGIMSGPSPPLPPRPSFMSLTPEYVMVLPSPASPPTTAQTPPLTKPPLSTDKGPLPGNPNVVLISLGKLLSEEREAPTLGEPVSCSRCGSVLDSWQKDEVEVCYICQSGDLTRPSGGPKSPLSTQRDELFLLNPEEQRLPAADSLLLFCIDASGSMSITSEVLEGGQNSNRSRLKFVQEAVLQCVQKLSDQQPDVRVGLITFNYQVTMHGSNHHQSQLLSGAELNDSSFLKEAAAEFPIPPPLSQTKDCLQRQILGLSANGETALGPAALLAITMASRLPGSKVIICTDGKANAKLGNLEEEDNDARTLLSSTIFYKDLGEYAANQGVTMSVLSIEGTDCRLEELGRLADRTGGKVVIANPNQLHAEFEEIIQNRTIATHCAVTILVPKSLRIKGEREAGHKGTREVGNVSIDTEITVQFGASEDTEVVAPASGSRVVMQLQIRYRKNGQALLRVFTVEKEVTADSSAALSSLSLAIIQLNSLQASAALAVRGRFLDAWKEGALQQKLIERAIEHNQSAEDEQTYQNWVKTMKSINNNIQNLTRRKSIMSDSESLTDAGAALLFTMKHSNRKSISLKDEHQSLLSLPR